MVREMTPALKYLMRLLNALGQEISMTEQNQVLTAMSLDTDNKILTFFDWMRSKEDQNRELTVNQEQIMHAVAQISRGGETGVKQSQKEKSLAEGEVKWSLAGKWPDGRKVYRSDYAKGTQKSIKQAVLIDLVQKVWSNKPIELHIGANESITAKFNPDLAERSDLAKMAYGNKKGTASDKRITLNLSGDFYAIAQDARYVGMRSEKEKDSPTHNNVSEWRYFVTDLVYEEDDGSHIACYMQIDVKRNDDGDWFYSFGIEKGTAPQTLLAVVTDNAATVPNNSLYKNEPIVKRKIQESRKAGIFTLKDVNNTGDGSLCEGNKKDTADRMNGLERPVGNALKSGVRVFIIAKMHFLSIP